MRLMPLSTRRCSDRMVHSPGQEGRILYQAGEMPHRAYRSRTCLGLDLRRNLCVSHQYNPPIVLPGLFFFNGSKRDISSFQLSALPCAPTTGGRRGDLPHCSSTRPGQPSHHQYLFTVGSSLRTRGSLGALLISLWSNWETRTHGTRHNPNARRCFHDIHD
jgi:hypothetical protein